MKIQSCLYRMFSFKLRHRHISVDFGLRSRNRTLEVAINQYAAFFEIIRSECRFLNGAFRFCCILIGGPF